MFFDNKKFLDVLGNMPQMIQQELPNMIEALSRSSYTASDGEHWFGGTSN